MIEWRYRRVACALTAVLIGVGLSGCFSDGSGQPDVTASVTPTLLPGVEPPNKTADPEPVSLDAVMVFAGVDPDGSAVSASGYIAGIVENGGACTFTFTGPGAPVVVTAEGAADSSTTSCGNAQASIDEFAQGTWTAVLSYRSDKAGELVAEPLTLEVP